MTKMRFPETGSSIDFKLATKFGTAALVVLTAGTLARDASAFALKTTTDSMGHTHNVQWASGPVTVSVQLASAADDRGLTQAVKNAIHTWNGLCGANLVFVETSPGSVQSSGAQQQDIVVKWSGGVWTFDKTWLASTGLNADVNTGHAKSALVDMNDMLYQWTTVGSTVAVDRNLSAMNIYDIEAVVTHELGHALGLNHSADTLATMYVDTSPGDPHKRHPDADDVKAVVQLYGAPGATPPVTTTMNQPVDMSASKGAGCSTTAGAQGDAALLLLVGLVPLFRRRRV